MDLGHAPELGALPRHGVGGLLRRLLAAPGRKTQHLPAQMFEDLAKALHPLERLVARHRRQGTPIGEPPRMRLRHRPGRGKILRLPCEVLDGEPCGRIVELGSEAGRVGDEGRSEPFQPATGRAAAPQHVAQPLVVVPDRPAERLRRARQPADRAVVLVARQLRRTPRLQRQPARQVLDHLRLAGLVAVQFEHEVAERDLLQLGLDDLERGELLGDEEDRLATLHRRCDEIGDGLRLAGAGRPLDHQGLLGKRRLQRRCLAGVGREDEGQIGEVPVVRLMRGLVEPDAPGLLAGQERGDERRAQRPPVLRPVRRVEVAPQQDLAEVEEAERHEAADRPARLVLHRLAHRPEVGLRPLETGDVRQFDPEAVLQLLGEAEVALDVLAAVREPRDAAAPDRRLGELCRHEDERREQAAIRPGRIGPVEEAERDEQRVGAGLLDVGVGGEPDLAGADVEFVGIEQRLQCRIPVPLGLLAALLVRRQLEAHVDADRPGEARRVGALARPIGVIGAGSGEPGFRLALARRPDGLERELLPLPDQPREDLVRQLVDEADRARLRVTVGEQRVAARQVEQLVPEDADRIEEVDGNGVLLLQPSLAIRQPPTAA